MKDVIASIIGLFICSALMLMLFLNPISVKEVHPPPPVTPSPSPTPTVPPVPRGIAKSYKVQKGDTLWDISAQKGYYNEPFLWPLILQDASDVPEIIDPDLILPNQRLVIRPVTLSRTLGENDTRLRTVVLSDGEIRRAERFARTRGPWNLHDGK